MSGHITSPSNDWLRNLLPHFLEQTRDRLIEIKGHQQAIRDGTGALTAMKAICDVAHKISGTADIFGFHDLGVFAREVERVFINELVHFDDPKVIWSHAELALLPLIQEIEKLLDHG